MYDYAVIRVSLNGVVAGSKIRNEQDMQKGILGKAGYSVYGDGR